MWIPATLEFKCIPVFLLNYLREIIQKLSLFFLRPPEQACHKVLAVIVILTYQTTKTLICHQKTVCGAVRLSDTNRPPWKKLLKALGEGLQIIIYVNIG